MPTNRHVNAGTLPDSEIRALCERNILIIENYSPANVKQACYELRASNIYYDLANNKQKYTLTDGQYILLKPKQLVVIITMESLNLPADILGRILTKGKLFSIGLLPVNTYADPGFKGKLGIVFCNLSNNFLKVYPTQQIAKIEFTRLPHPVDEPYQGQHGYQTEIWPIPEDMLLTEEELRMDNRIKSTSEEMILSYGEGIGSVIDRVFRFERRLIFAVIAYLFMSTLLIALIGKSATWLTPLITISLGVVSNIATAVLIHYATSLKR
jgi:dCTP deaminase